MKDLSKHSVQEIAVKGWEKISYWYRRWRYSSNLFFSRFEKQIVAISRIFDSASGIAALACLVALTVYVGYDLSEDDRDTLRIIFRVAQLIFTLGMFYEVFFLFKARIRHSKVIKWIVDTALFLSVAAWIYPEPNNPWFPWLSNIIYHARYLPMVLGAYSLVIISFIISRIPTRRTNPSLLMAGSFLFFIIAGSFVLMLPRCTYHSISYFDSLFLSSSAVCITGLTPVDIPSTFTPLGLLVLSVLVQLGSLGLITFTSFFALFFTGNTSIYNQLMLRDIIYSKSMNSLIPTLLYVLGFTVVIELCGAFFVYLSLPSGLGMDFEDKLMFSAFHSMSAFCNAGFSCLPQGMSNPVLLNSNQNIYLITSALIFLGAIGFPILVNFREILIFYFHKVVNRLSGKKTELMRMHIFDLNTKLVLYTTLIILGVATISFFILEYDNSLQGMNTYHKAVQSLFNSLVPRSAGFASVNPATFLDVTLLLIMIQMFIGGSSQSMAGGIKVNTFGTVMLNLRSVLFGHQGTSAFNRTINTASVRRANAMIVICASTLFIYVIVMLLLEPQFSTKEIVFETVSSLFTVGSSLGITPNLSNVSKVVLCSAMFLGRVGLLSLLCGMFNKSRDLSPYLPNDNIIIN